MLRLNNSQYEMLSVFIIDIFLIVFNSQNKTNTELFIG